MYPSYFDTWNPPFLAHISTTQTKPSFLHTKASYRLANLLVSRDTYPSSNSIILRREHGDLGSHLHMPYVFGTYKGTHRRYACLSTPHAVLGARSTSSQTPWHPGHLTSKSQANLTIITSRKNKGAWEKGDCVFFFSDNPRPDNPSWWPWPQLWPDWFQTLHTLFSLHTCNASPIWWAHAFAIQRSGIRVVLLRS